MIQSLKNNQLSLVKIFIYMIFLVLGCSAYAASKDSDGRSPHSFPEWFVDSPFLDLKEVKDDAIGDGKKGLMILYTTQGCSYCAEFIKRSLGDPDIAKIVQSRFASIGLEIFDDAGMVSPTGVEMPVKKFALQEGVGFAPTLLFFDKDGKRILRQVGYQSPERFLHLMDFVAEERYQSETLSDFIASKISKDANSSTYTKLRVDTLFDNLPYALDRSQFAASEPLMVLFEKTGCNECEVFHEDVLKLKDVRVGLKNFQIVRMDVNDNKTPVLLPNGKLSTPSKWYKESEFSRVPALMFFNNTGGLSLKTDAYIRSDRMLNSINYMREKAYLKDWTYQQFARSKAIERSQK